MFTNEQGRTQSQRSGAKEDSSDSLRGILLRQSDETAGRRAGTLRRRKMMHLSWEFTGRTVSFQHAADRRLLTHNLVSRHGLLTRHSVPLVKHIIKPHTMMTSDLDDNNYDRLRGCIVNMRCTRGGNGANSCARMVQVNNDGGERTCEARRPGKAAQRNMFKLKKKRVALKLLLFTGLEDTRGEIMFTVCDSLRT